jgi:hypothetical protein
MRSAGRPRGAWLLAFPLVAAAAPAAAHPYFCQVAQPMVNREAARIEVHEVTYFFDLSTPMPGLEIQLTCQPGPVIARREQAVMDSSVDASEIMNLNVANLLGLVVRVEARPQGSWSADPDTSAAARAGGVPRERFYVGQLRVDLDVASLAERLGKTEDAAARRKELAQYDALVEATVACIRENARRSHPEVRTIRLSVVGWDRYRRFNRTYDVAQGWERRVFTY